MKNFVGEIERIDWYRGPNRIYFEGYAFLEGVSISESNQIKKSIIISNENKNKKFFVPLENVFNNNIRFKKNYDKNNYDYSGFRGFIDLGFINDMQPISRGDWSISLYINCGGYELEENIKYNGEIENIENKELVGSNKNIVYKVYLTKNEKQEIILKVDECNRDIRYRIKNNDMLTMGISYIRNKKRAIGNKVLQEIYKGFKKIKTRGNRVTFLSDSRVDFTGNFEFIHKELQNRGTYEIKSILKPSISAKRSLKDKIRLVYYVATSKYILLDDYYPQIYKLKIKHDVEVIQLWHATGAFKTFGFSRLGKKGGPSVRSKNHRNYTKAIVSSNSIRKHYAEAFGISENKVISTGVPRTDIFFDEKYKEEKINEIYSKYPILKDKKVIMFAPTFRGNGQKTAHYDFENLNIDELYKNLSQEYVIIMKLHPFISNIPNIDDKYKDFIIDLSSEREINDLLFVSDILITDYSSVCFEYALLNRPMIFFAYDLEEYIASRDFYYPYESFVPGPIAKTTEDIIDIIENNRFEKEKLEKFRNKFFDHFDGKSTERVVDTLLKIKK